MTVGTASPKVSGYAHGRVPREVRVAQIDRLRVLVSLPQTEASGIHVGQQASVSVEEFSNQVFPGQITRTSNALDAASRTLLTEVQVVNRAETRNGGHRTAFDPLGRVDARVHRATVDDDGTGTAIARVATLFHFEMSMLAQKCAQALTGPRLTFELFPVHLEPHASSS